MIANYVCLQLNSNFSPNYRYYYHMYSYVTKRRTVLQKQTYTKLGEALCSGKVVNFLKDTEHQRCCGSVYFNAVF